MDQDRADPIADVGNLSFFIVKGYDLGNIIFKKAFINIKMKIVAEIQIICKLILIAGKKTFQVRPKHHFVGIKQIAEMSPVLVGSGIGQQRTGHEIIFGSNHIGKMRVIR